MHGTFAEKRIKRSKFATISIFICVTFAILGLVGLVPHGESNLWWAFGPILMVTGVRTAILFFQTLMESAQKKQYGWLIAHFVTGIFASLIYYFRALDVSEKAARD